MSVGSQYRQRHGEMFVDAKIIVHTPVWCMLEVAAKF